MVFVFGVVWFFGVFLDTVLQFPPHMLRSSRSPNENLRDAFFVLNWGRGVLLGAVLFAGVVVLGFCVVSFVWWAWLGVV